ncbi:MAG: glutaredoxin domain-containing protein [Alphaproteobacteria bacterium]|nr:glutaredoxin domain-containing protein [Alphaproteobacteria bacterium]
MKKASLLSAFLGLAFVGSASAADITVYYSPSCPHCHHAREFISNTLVYEYPELKVTEVNVMEQENLPMFQDALKKCGFESGGVPVLVIGDKCEQGYADFMQDTLREYVEADMNAEQKDIAAANKKAMAEDAEKFRTENSERANAVSEYVVPAEEEKPADVATADNKGNSTIWFWGLLIVLVAGLGYVLVRKDKKK